MKKNILPILFLILLIPFSAYGQQDIFQVKTPNAMIIFDTSSSMNMNPSGISVSSHNACIDANGNLQTTNQGHPPCSGVILPIILSQEQTTLTANSTRLNWP